MDAGLDEKELMELMQELQKVKEENLEIINNVINNTEEVQKNQKIGVEKNNNQKLIQNLNPINENKSSVNNEIGSIELQSQEKAVFPNNENRSVVNNLLTFNQNLERKLVDLFNQLISLINNEFLLIKKENERSLKFQKIFAKTLMTLINQNKTSLIELKEVKKELNFLKQERESKKEEQIKELLLRELGDIKASFNNLNKVLVEQNIGEKEIKGKLINLLEINKKVNESLADKIIKLEKELLLLIEGIEEMKLYLKLNEKIGNE